MKKFEIIAVPEANRMFVKNEAGFYWEVFQTPVGKPYLLSHWIPGDKRAIPTNYRQTTEDATIFFKNYAVKALPL
jgi:hypothetical protein